MAKTPNVPCSNGCGRLLWTGGKQAQYSAPTCRPCRSLLADPSQEEQRARWREYSRQRYLAGQASCQRNGVPCSSCGKILATSAKSLPVGERICHPCRRDRRDRLGPEERRKYNREYNRRRRGALRPRPEGERTGRCRDCGETISLCALYCAEHSRARKRAYYRRKNAIRRGSPTRGTPTISITQLGDRDGWRCHLCRRRVHRHLRAPHPGSATFDHLVPVSDGGPDTPENLRLAHWRCNSRRGAGGTVQLLLVG